VKIIYILNGTALCGGVSVVYQHATVLRERGLDAEVISPAPPSDWAPESHVFYRQVPALTPEFIGPTDIAIGTIAPTVPVALGIRGAVAFHLCQGYEGLYEPARQHWPEIEAVYALPARKLVVSQHLADLVAARFGQSARLIPQPFNPTPFSRRDAPRAVDGTFRVLLTGQWGVPVKGIAWAFDALRPLQAVIPGLKIVRLSQDSPGEELSAWPDAERHVHIPPARVPEVFHSVDLFVGPSSEAEGFGLPTLEAMAAGLPCVLTDIGAFRTLDPAARASLRVRCGDVEALRAAVLTLSGDRALRERLGREGRAIAAGFSPQKTADALVAAFDDALSGRWPVPVSTGTEQHTPR
jgi:glycosyltransferase involved in cell wall biosynthesis